MERWTDMSARIVVNLADGVAHSAIDRAPDGGLWLSLWQRNEVVIFKLSMPGMRALQQTLSTQVDPPSEPERG